VKVAPNPSTGYFTLIIRSVHTERITIRIMDISGKLVETRTELVPNTNIQVGAGLRPGLYFAEIIQGAKKERVKLLKE
jgi:hypothetical protein